MWKILVCTVAAIPSTSPFRRRSLASPREHSRKPDEVYDLVLSHTPQAIRRADLFSRQTRPRFWGDEHGGGGAGQAD
jgi:N6-adenosine-specific RNA methylase IME4